MKHVQRCLLGADPQSYFPQQVMQHNGISLGRTHTHFQAMLWRQAHKTNHTLPLPAETMGWTKSVDGKLVPKLMTLALEPES